MAGRSDGRSGPHGIVLLDKPLGLSSNQALQQVKHLFRAKRAGHTGSLDPLATGMLPICLGEGTKVAGHLLGSRKAYRAGLDLGVTTTTADREGEVVETRPVPELDAATIENALSRFRGPIRQRPPAHSALKQGGERLYLKARRGEDVVVPERDVVIERLECVGREGQTLVLEVECSTGTYIRSLAVDLGAALGCGAHLAGLRRLWVEPFRHSPMWTMVALGERVRAGVGAELVLPIDTALAGWPELRLDPDETVRFRRGHEVERPDVEWEGNCRVYGADGTLCALAERGPDGRVRPRRVFLQD
jgi:tRNA pseudouridine55 synthase